MSGTGKDPPPWMAPEDGTAPAAEGEASTQKPEGGQEAAAAEQPPSEKETRRQGPEDIIEGLNQQLKDTKDRMLRIAADFDNFRKRSRRDQEEARVKGREEVLSEMLVVFDNLERAIDAAGEHEGLKAGPIIDGIRMVQKQFEDNLGKFGLKRFSAMGQPFDPNLHDAIGQLVTDEHPIGTIVKELQKGYKLGERLLRAATVVVAKPPAAKQADAGGEKKDNGSDAGPGTDVPVSS